MPRLRSIEPSFNCNFRFPKKATSWHRRLEHWESLTPHPPRGARLRAVALARGVGASWRSMRSKTTTWYGWLALASLASCTDTGGGELRGRLFVAQIAGADGTAVGLAVDFIRTSGPRDAVKTVELSVIAHGAEFVGVSLPTCVRFSDSGRLSFQSETSLPTTARVVLTAHQPGETSALSAAGAAGAAGAADDETTDVAAPTCKGAVLDDAVWPTKGAQVTPLPPGTGGATGSATTTGSSQSTTGTLTTATTTGTAAGGASGTMSTSGTTGGGANSMGGAAGAAGEGP